MRPGTGPQDPRRRRPDRRRAPRLRFPAHPFPGAQRRGKEGIACAAPETETAPGRRLGQRNEVATGGDKAPSHLPPGVTPTQLAAYTVVSRVLLNLDETITKE